MNENEISKGDERFTPETEYLREEMDDARFTGDVATEMATMRQEQKDQARRLVALASKFDGQLKFDFTKSTVKQ